MANNDPRNRAENYYKVESTLWQEFERRHNPRIITVRVSDLTIEDATGNFPQQFSDVLDVQGGRRWYNQERYDNASLTEQAKREWWQLACIHGHDAPWAREKLIAAGYDAAEVERVNTIVRAREEEHTARTRQYADED